MLLSRNCPEESSCGLVSLKLEVRRIYGFLWYDPLVAGSPPPLGPINPLLSTISTQSAVRLCRLVLSRLPLGPEGNSSLGFSRSCLALEVWPVGSGNGAVIWKWLGSASWELKGWAVWMSPVDVGMGELVGEADISNKVSFTGLEETWYVCVASFKPFFFISFSCCWASLYLGVIFAFVSNRVKIQEGFNHLNVPKHCGQHLLTSGRQPFWVLRDRYHQGPWHRQVLEDRRGFLGYTRTSTPERAVAVWLAASSEAVATDGRFVRELAPSGGMHGPSVDGAALRSLAKLSPHAHHNGRQNHSQTEGDAKHHHHINTEKCDSNRHGGYGWRWSRPYWGWKGADILNFKL